MRTLCAIEVFLDLIKRHVIRKVHQQPLDGKPFFSDEAWQEISKTLDAHPPNLLWSSREAADPDERRYLMPDWCFEYELEVDRVNGFPKSRLCRHVTHHEDSRRFGVDPFLDRK